MRCHASLSVFLLFFACGTAERPSGSTAISPNDDIRFVVLGPSLVELMHVCGLSTRIVGVDRYSQWPTWIDSLQSVGGYLDPSFEQIAALDPTSLHIAGTSSSIHALAVELGIPCYTYSFDNLTDIYSVLDSLDLRYGGKVQNFRTQLENTFDSLLVLSEGSNVSAMIVLDHSMEASGMTIAGHGVFLTEVLEEIGGTATAPSEGSWPTVSLEGVLQLAPDVIISIYSSVDDTVAVRASELDFWTDAGFSTEHIHVLFGGKYMIPGGRIGNTAERLSECIR